MESDLLLMEFAFKQAIINLYGILIFILLNANVALLLTEYTELFLGTGASLFKALSFFLYKQISLLDLQHLASKRLLEITV